MGIRAKIVLIVLPLIIAPLLFTAIVSGLSARNGITTIATQFLRFKSEELVSYAANQWSLLENNQLEDNVSFVEAAKAAVQSFAVGVTRSKTELIFAAAPDGTIEMQTKPFELVEGERGKIAELAAEGVEGWREMTIGGVGRVANIMNFEPFGWHIFVTEERASFYEAIYDIVFQVLVILCISLAVASLLLLLFVGYLTRPLRNVVTAMTDIITTNDLSKRVEVIYKDEIGRLGHTFNIMVQELQSAYDNIKGYALRAVVAQMKEQNLPEIRSKGCHRAVLCQPGTDAHG